MTDPFLSMKSL